MAIEVSPDGSKVASAATSSPSTARTPTRSPSSTRPAGPTQDLPRLHPHQLRDQGHRQRNDGRFYIAQRGHRRRGLRRPARPRLGAPSTRSGATPASAPPRRPRVPRVALHRHPRSRLLRDGTTASTTASATTFSAQGRHRPALGWEPEHQRRHRRGHRPPRDDGRDRVGSPASTTCGSAASSPRSTASPSRA